MNRKEFMRQLESLLQNISSTEREEALQYYNDYFDDAGAENEQSVIEALGNPAKVAENIKRDIYENGYNGGNNIQASASDRAVIPYGEGAAGEEEADEDHGRAEMQAINSVDMLTDTQEYGSSRYGNNTSANSVAASAVNEEKKLSTGMIVLIVVLCVLAAPIILSIASGILGVLGGLIAAWFSLSAGFGIAAIVLLIVFVILLVVAAISLIAEPLAAVALLGGGMICGGLGILFLMLTIAMTGIATPAIVRGLVALVKKLAGKKQAE